MSDTANPLIEDWTASFGLAPFDEIEPAHYLPAFEAAMAEHKANIDRITGNSAAPDFANTIEALEKAHDLLNNVSSVFFNLTGSNTNPDLQKIEREIAPKMARHRNDIIFNEALFERIDALWSDRDNHDLTTEQARVLERYHTMGVRAGAALKGDARQRLKEINERLAVLGTQFSQNVLADENAFVLVLDTEDDLAGLPEALVSAAARAAEERGHPGKHVITLSRSSIEPFLTFSAHRSLREMAYKAWLSRGENGGETDNRALIAETSKLRAERAALAGYANYAAFKLEDQMAGTPDAVRDLLMNVWTPARARALEEAADLQALAAEQGGNFELAAWDWRYYAEKQRKKLHDLSEAEVKPYLQLDKMIEAAFDTATRLFGVQFREIDGLTLYHDDVRAFEVTDSNGKPVGLFLGDYFARPSKRSGAWMSGFRTQHKLDGDVRPIIVNVMNFAAGAEGEPCLLTVDDARTLFHEFGHALHGLLSDVTYPTISGTSVQRDFVELPSQLFEHWLLQPATLEKFAVHYQTGKPMPQALIERIKAAEAFNQGFATVEYVSSALVDLAIHERQSDGLDDIVALEAQVLDGIGMPDAISMRHRTPHFAHVFAGEGYSAGYYSYMWSEVMDADAFDAFVETGNVFDAGTAAKLKDNIYSAGGRQDGRAAYTAFRGRMPDIQPLLRHRGLAG